jgi:hypothetical protein
MAIAVISGDIVIRCSLFIIHYSFITKHNYLETRNIPPWDINTSIATVVLELSATISV